jgi:hypothetical protein
MAKSIAQLAAELTAAQTAARSGDQDATAELDRVRGELHTHPSTRGAVKRLDGCGSAGRASAKRGDRR